MNELKIFLNCLNAHSSFSRIKFFSNHVRLIIWFNNTCSNFKLSFEG
jgi:hypothetical protein